VGETLSGGPEFLVRKIRRQCSPSCQRSGEAHTATIPSQMKSSRLLQIVLRVVSSPRVIFLMALIARLRVLSELVPAYAWRDFYRYNEPSHIAWALVSGFGYSAPWPNTPVAATAQQPPLYPLLLAAIFKLAGSYSYLSLWIAVLLNAFFSSLTAMLILRVGKRDFGVATAILAAWVWACWPYEAVVSIRLWESALSGLLLMIGLLLAPELAESLRVSRWLLFGALAGIAALTNTTLLSVFPFFWLWLWINYQRRGKSCSRVLLGSIAVCVLTLLPWTIRNYEAFHRLMPIRDNFGLELWVGLELKAGRSGAAVAQPFPQDFPLNNPTEYNRLGEIGFMESRRQMAFSFVRQYPREYLNMVINRSFKFWSEPVGTPWPFVSLLAWLGLCLALWRKRPNAGLYAIVLVVFPPVYYMTHTFPTYRHPIEPQILLLAACAVVAGGQTVAKLAARGIAD
jgi:4-amino-4-deoxy-L-arabinose transferase-like glycosyltransferase